MKKMEIHAKNLGANALNDKIIDIKKNKKWILFHYSKWEKINSKTILLTTGTKSRKLKINNENGFIGRDVSYCATCDALFYQNKNVAVAGEEGQTVLT